MSIKVVKVTSVYGFEVEGGLYYRTMFGRRCIGFRTYDSEALVRQAIAGSVEEDRQCDEDDARYSAMYHY